MSGSVRGEVEQMQKLGEDPGGRPRAAAKDHGGAAAQQASSSGEDQEEQ